jgi:hypothetical protein
MGFLNAEIAEDAEVFSHGWTQINTDGEALDG